MASNKVTIRPYDAFSLLKLLIKYNLKDCPPKKMRPEEWILLTLSWPLRIPRPGWSGTIQAISRGICPVRTTFPLLPMIDLSFSDYTCIFSSLSFVVHTIRRYDPYHSSHFRPTSLVKVDFGRLWSSRVRRDLERQPFMIDCPPARAFSL